MPTEFSNGIDYTDRSDFLAKLNENYDDIHEINKGGGGIIYSGIHRRLGQKVVLKKIRSDHVGVIGIDREIEILTSLKHTYLPRVLDFWRYGNEIYTVMEFIEGSSFQELLDRGETFTEKQVVRWTRQLAEVLDYMHTSEAQVIHSDIKPANIMLTPGNDICLIDFNISVTQDGKFDEAIGYTPGYAPVEQYICTELRRVRLRSEAKPAAVQTRPAAPAADDRTMIDDPDRTMITELNSSDADRTMIDDPDRTMITGLKSSSADRTMIDDISASPVRTEKRTVQPASRPKKPEKMLSGPAADMVRKYGTKLRVDARSDIYSACATMYHLLTGHKPEPCYMTQKPVDKLNPSVSEAFADIIMHGMEQDPKKRFKTAGEMLKAMTKLAKSNRRFKRMRFLQDFTVVLLTAVFAVSAVAAYTGSKMKLTSRFDSLLEEADRLYLSGSYQEAIELVDSELISGVLTPDDSQLAGAYYIKGCCRLETGDYSSAAEAFAMSILLDGDSAQVFRDYGIALANCGEIDRAEECLKQARALGLDDISLLLLEGELDLAKGDFTAAAEELRLCLDKAPEGMTAVRAGIKLDEAMAAQGESAQSYSERCELLSALADRLDGAYRLPVLERLAQTAIDGGAFTGDQSYTERAVKALDEVIAANYATLTDHLSRAVCLQSLKRFDEAREGLLTAAVKYPDSYEIYKRLAFMEIEYQASLSAGERDYQVFDGYFKACRELYDAKTRTEQDIEMDYLDRVRKEVLDKGWLDN